MCASGTTSPKAALEEDDRGFTPEVSVFATIRWFNQNEQLPGLGWSIRWGAPWGTI